jgi:hypothetical protein
MIRMAGIFACALALVGCNQTTGSGQQASGGDPMPPNYREQVAAEVRKTFFDPYTVRDAQISAPIPGVSFLGAMNSVCVRANAKNRMGGYTGAKDTVFVFRGGVITTADQQYAGMICSTAAYEPFPEIEESYRPPSTAPAKRRG